MITIGMSFEYKIDTRSISESPSIIAVLRLFIIYSQPYAFLVRVVIRSFVSINLKCVHPRRSLIGYRTSVNLHS